MPSVRFQKLKRRIISLEKRLIPVIRPAGDYTPRQQDLIRSYRLLAHAEFEAYLEDRSLEIADKALQSFTIKQRTGKALTSLMTFSPLSPQSTPSSLKSKGFDTTLTRVYRIVKNFKASISDGNHGIKESNVISMLFPIGFEEMELDTTLIGTLNSYGSDRGATAHRSAYTQKPIDPVTEVKTINWITAEFEKLDALFSKKKQEN